MATERSAATREPFSAEAQVVLVLEGFIRAVFFDVVQPRYIERLALRIHRWAIEQVLTYVEGRADLRAVLVVFSISEPRFAGLYFPAPDALAQSRWPAAAALALEALVDIRLARERRCPSCAERAGVAVSAHAQLAG